MSPSPRPKAPPEASARLTAAAVASFRTFSVSRYVDRHGPDVGIVVARVKRSYLSQRYL